MIVAIVWTLLALNIVRRLGVLRPLAPVDGPLPEGLPGVDVIVPARNEERDFEDAFRSILAQEYPGLRIVLIDDESTDGTLALMRQTAAEDDRVEVVEGRPRPRGWVGKTWAVHQGYLTTRSDWLCFVDADMQLDPRAIATAMAAAVRESADLVSLMPRVDCRTFWQGAVATAFLQVLVQLYPLDRVNDPRSKAAIAAGGFILIRRQAYEAVGGHEAGRNDIVEDIRLARRVKDSGGRIYVRLAPGLATTHMYGTFAEIWRGLRKNAFAGMDYQFYKFAFGAVGSLLLAWGPLIALTRGATTASWGRIVVGLWGIVAQAAATLPLTAFLRISPLFALTVPAGITVYVAIAASSVWHHLHGRIHWKGRTLDVADVLSAPNAEGEPRG